MKFPDWVDQYIGIPFTEYNCWQLVRKVYREQFNIDLPLLDNEYFNHMDRTNIEKLYNRELAINWKKQDVPRIGDCVVMRIRNQPWHVGIIISKDTMLHTENKLEAVRERFTGPAWKNNIIGFYRYEPKR
jgi:cell wall-associated NlpC family hydrolase